MRAGDFRHRVTIQSSTETEDGYGGVSLSWSDDFTIWARVRPQAGRERFDAEQQEGTFYTHVIEARYRTDITTEQRATWDGRILDITSVQNVEGMDRELRIECHEVV